MAEAEIPLWLKNLPLAPVYRPTETEFADPIAFISRIEREAASFGICKIIPPLPRPSKKFVIANLNRSLSKSPELDAIGPSSETPVFTTRQQELGSRRARPAYPKQVWQSGDLYTLEQFECKSKAFARSKLGGFKEVTPLLVESLFWKAVAEKPIYIDYANDVPGSGFAVPEEPFRYISWRRNRKRGLPRVKLNEEKCEFRLMRSNDNGMQKKSLGEGNVADGSKGTSGWKLSNSRWNLQVIARSPGSLTRFMPDDVPGVTSPMVYIGMLFSWFAWHVEDHELHSMNFLHMGSPKTWYAVPQDHAATLEDIVRVKGYGESVDRLAAFTMLGEKTTLLSPEVLVTSGVPCCRLVQHPGEFVVTFPRAYHVGFSHGFNCGEAANFATPEWLKVAKEAAIRRAAMNHLPMLSHQQLLYILTMSFVSRIPRTLISGVRSSRLRDRKKEEREIFVKKTFLKDMMNQNYLLCLLLEKESTYAPILWEPGMLPAHCAVSQSYPSISLEAQYCYDQHGCCDRNQKKQIKTNGASIPQVDDFCMEKPIDEALALMNSRHVSSFIESYKNPIHTDLASDVEALEIVEDEGDLPVGLNIDSGSLACVSCGTLGYPFMAVMQPSEKALKMLFSSTCEESQKSDKSQHLIPSLFLQDDACNSNQEERFTADAKLENPASQFPPKSSSTLQYSSEHDTSLSMDNCSLLNCLSMDSLEDKGGELTLTNTQTERRKCHFDRATNTLCFNGFRPCDSKKQFGGSWPMKNSKIVKNGLSSTSEPFSGGVNQTSLNEKVGAPKWDVNNVLLRPRIFCLQHAIEVEELLQNKGGGHIRVICHSDYLKFKAYASSIAEEVGVLLHLKDVPLENASQEDLNVINLSIDEEEHQEDGKDWTSKLGVNLRYTVKQRKNSALTQEKLPSALSRMFSSSSTISVASSLRWLNRKSRTPAKPMGIIVEKSHISANVSGGVKTWKETYSTNVKAIQVYKSRKKSNDLAYKDHNHPVEEIDSCKQISDNLFTVPISMVGNNDIFQISVGKQNSGPLFDSFQLTAKPSIESYEVYDQCFSEFDSKFLVPVPVMFKFNISALNSSEPPNSENNEGECSADSDGGRCKSLELQNDMPIPLVESSEVKLLTGTFIETDSVPEFHDSVEPLLLTAGEDERVRENLAAEEQNAEVSPRISLSAEDHVDVLGYDHEMHIEAPVEELGSAICAVHCEGEVCDIAPTEDEMQKSENPVERENDSKGEVGRMHLESFPSEAADVQLGEAYSAMDPIATIASGGNDCSRGIFAVRDEGLAGPMNIKSYVRRKNKRKREEACIEEEKSIPLQEKAEKHEKNEAWRTNIGFVRSPCEGLRSRKRNGTPAARTECKVINRRISKAARIRKGEASGTFECDIEGCPMVFRTKSELQLHRHNRCTYPDCRKRFSNHKYAIRHQRVHNDERPLKCPWKGCAISFKWEWARTEHLRLHTGERPYRCKAPGCGQSFRFVSDFSRHRRKTGHFVSSDSH